MPLVMFTTAVFSFRSSYPVHLLLSSILSIFRHTFRQLNVGCAMCAIKNAFDIVRLSVGGTLELCTPTKRHIAPKIWHISFTPWQLTISLITFWTYSLLPTGARCHIRPALSYSSKPSRHPSIRIPVTSQTLFAYPLRLYSYLPVVYPLFSLFCLGFPFIYLVRMIFIEHTCAHFRIARIKKQAEINFSGHFLQVSLASQLQSQVKPANAW